MMKRKKLSDFEGVELQEEHFHRSGDNHITEISGRNRVRAHIPTAVIHILGGKNGDHLEFNIEKCDDGGFKCSVEVIF